MFKPKFKICYQTKSNIWKTSKILKNFKKPKWSFINLKKKVAYRHHSLRQSDIFISRLYSLIDINKDQYSLYSKKKKIKSFVFSKKNDENLFNFHSRNNFNRKFFIKKFFSFVFFLRSLKKQNFFEKQFFYKNIFKKNLFAFQKMRKQFGKISLKVFKRFSYKFFRYKPLHFSTNNSFLYLKRLDVFLSSFHFGLNIFFIQNLIKHNFFSINSQRIQNYNFIVKKGDIIRLNFLSNQTPMRQILWKFYKKPLYYRKSLFKNKGEVNWNTLSLISIE